MLKFNKAVSTTLKKRGKRHKILSILELGWENLLIKKKQSLILKVQSTKSKYYARTNTPDDDVFDKKFKINIINNGTALQKNALAKTV